VASLGIVAISDQGFAELKARTDNPMLEFRALSAAGEEDLCRLIRIIERS
jgi:hypothetical protein